MESGMDLNAVVSSRVCVIKMGIDWAWCEEAYSSHVLVGGGIMSRYVR